MGGDHTYMYIYIYVSKMVIEAFDMSIYIYMYTCLFTKGG